MASLLRKNIDLSEKVVDVSQRELDDCRRSGLYREYEPDFAKTREEGRKAVQRLIERYCSTPPN